MASSSDHASSESGISTASFYGKNNDGKSKYISVLPPVDPSLSDIGSSSSDEDIFGNGDDSDLDPTYIPENNRKQNLPAVATFDHWDSDDEEPSSSSRQTPRCNKIKKDYHYKWAKQEFQHAKQPTEAHFTQPNEILTPAQYFSRFFDTSMFEHIVHHTNLYSAQQTSSSLGTSVTEMKAFIAIHLFMGIVKMPSFEDYWAVSTRYDQTATVMPVRRFKNLRRFIHFQDNNLDSNNDRLFKIRPILEKLRQNCLNIENENKFSIDEMMVPYKGTKAGNLRQYLPKKPKKWGFKMFIRAGVSGIVYDFLVYTGSNTFKDIQFTEKEELLGLSAKVVVTLCQSIQHPHDSIVYFDNFFSSLDLIKYLKEEKNICSLGTIRNNRLKGCTLETDKDLLKRGRGSFDYKVDNTAGIAIVKWADTKCVTLASSCVSYEPLFEVKRYSKEDKRKISVSCPQIIKQYNSHMGGVDLADMLIALYKTPLKSRRWYLGLFSQMIDIAVNNAWLLYRRDLELCGNKKYDKLKTFRANIASSLLQCGNKGRKKKSLENENIIKKIKVPVLPRPAFDVIHDNVGHLPQISTKGRCRHCATGQTTVLCEKCNVRLCLVTGNSVRNCFSAFHTK